MGIFRGLSVGLLNVVGSQEKANSLKKAVSKDKNLSLDYYIFETDSKVLVEACNGKQHQAYFDTILLDYIDLYKHFDQVLIDFVYRLVNRLEHLSSQHSMSGFRE